MNFGRMLLLTNNNKKSTQKLRQIFSSIILSASCIIPVVAGNEKTHVDKSKKSTSSWLRTGLELLLGAGCVGGVIREFQNRNTINSKDKTISDLTQTIKETAKDLTADQKEELTALKALIEKVYNEQKYTKYLKITNESVEYKVDNILSLSEASTLGLTNENFKPTNETGIIKAFKPDISETSFDYAQVHTVPPYDSCLQLLAQIELKSIFEVLFKTTSAKLAKTDKDIELLTEKICTTNLNEIQKKKIVYKFCVAKLITLSGCEISNKNFWKASTTDSSTEMQMNELQMHVGEYMLALRSKELFNQSTQTPCVGIKTVKGSLWTTPIIQSNKSTQQLFKSLRKKPNEFALQELKIENKQPGYAVTDFAKLFSGELVFPNLFSLPEFYGYETKHTDLYKEAVLIILSIKFFNKYCGSKFEEYNLSYHETTNYYFVNDVNTAWKSFENYMRSLGLEQADFSNALPKDFIFDNINIKTN